MSLGNPVKFFRIYCLLETFSNSTKDDNDGLSDCESASEDEIRALLCTPQDDHSDSESLESLNSSVDSEHPFKSYSETGAFTRNVGCQDQEHSDDDLGLLVPGGGYFPTKNESLEWDILVPDIERIAPDEHIEMVGEIISVVGNLAIVKGVPLESYTREAQGPLDSETLLVFEDRSVMGYIYETFGPTSRPFYQVKFNDTFTLNPERIRISREVFHVPSRSIFVFLGRIKKDKGSDASNVYDEEPEDNERDFSDDEAEAAFRKERWGNSRNQSIISSRQPSLTPSQIHEKDTTDEFLFSRNPYDELSPYDLGFTKIPSRPLPAPYDDPYAYDHKSLTFEQLYSNVNNFDGKPKINWFEKRKSDRARCRERSRGRGGARKEFYPCSEDGNVSGRAWSNQESALRPVFQPRISRTPALTGTCLTEPILGYSDHEELCLKWNYHPPNLIPQPRYPFCEILHPTSQLLFNPSFDAAFNSEIGAPSLTTGRSFSFVQNDSFYEKCEIRSGSSTSEWTVPVTPDGEMHRVGFSGVVVE